ncbi:DUF2066 domain-containing protein [Rhodospirillum rubrum]|uniref:DUF2066 domain-containing protein n=1 Tax=Rhodospirillum rubrum TaxID=1085 RepID=UPI001390E96E|nr:DUF2066 domain-containing protein [Rhodospirillum rubrum]QXG78952.1 DUF2066 domain-containing protein [Rhodospirillum rubrum]
MALAPLGPMATAPAWAADAYKAPPINVDVTAGSPTEARQKAINDGQVKALRALLESLTTEGDHARLPAVTARDADAMVVDFGLANEKTAAKRYLATLNVRFNAAMVDRLLASSGIGHATTRDAPVLVLPVYQPQPSDPPQLWEDTNPWNEAWNKQTGLSEGLVPLVLGLGDIEDISALDGKRALSADAAASGLAQRYGASDVLVLKAEGTAESGLTITAVGGGPFSAMAPVSVEPGPQAFKTAVAKARAALETAWKTQGGKNAGAAATAGVSDMPAFGGGAGVPQPGQDSYATVSGAGTTYSSTAPTPVAPAWGYGESAAAPGASGYGAAAGASGYGAAPGASGYGAAPGASGYGAVPGASGYGAAPGVPPYGQTQTMAGGMVVVARYANLAEWVEMRRKLQGLPGVTALNLQAVTRNQAQINLGYGGSPMELAQVLLGRGLRLSESAGLWTLESMGGATPGLAPVGATPGLN